MQVLIVYKKISFESKRGVDLVKQINNATEHTIDINKHLKITTKIAKKSVTYIAKLEKKCLIEKLKIYITRIEDKNCCKELHKDFKKLNKKLKQLKTKLLKYKLSYKKDVKFFREKNKSLKDKNKGF